MNLKAVNARKSPKDTKKGLRFLLLLFCCGKEDVIQDQPIPRRIRMLIKISGLFIYLMLIVFRIVSAIEGPETFAQNPMNIFGFANVFVFTHDDSIGLYEIFLEPCCLSEETLHHTCVILGEHRRDRIPLGREFEY
jgi:hypothetical protein